jgi:hypothetical protein
VIPSRDEAPTLGQDRTVGKQSGQEGSHFLEKEAKASTTINLIDVGEKDETFNLLAGRQRRLKEKLRYCAWGSRGTKLEKIGIFWIGIE